MEHQIKKESAIAKFIGSSTIHMRRCLFKVLSMGPIPEHMAFILDGNRRYARKWNLEDGMGHRAGFLSLMTLLKYCCELGVKYVTIYAFSIDNFRRKPEQVQAVMDLMLEKIEGMLKEESVVNRYGVRVHFIGNLKLLDEPIRVAAEKAMKATAGNSKSILMICVAYTSTDEIAHAAQESCLDVRCLIGGGGKIDLGKNNVITVGDVERHMHMGIAPDPDVLVRTSGESRLSNFLLWQTTNCLLYSPEALWPEIGLRHLVWAVVNFQRMHPYREKRRKQM